MNDSTSFLNGEIERISNVLGDTSSGLTGSEISSLLEHCEIPDICPSSSKRVRLFKAFIQCSKQSNNTNCVYAFVQETFSLARRLNCLQSREEMLIKINEVLALKGLQLNNENCYVNIQKAETIFEARQRASKLKDRLYSLHVHPFVMKCCREELLQENYFHAVLEAAKSLTNRIASSTGLNLDGTQLIERAFSVGKPAVIMNSLKTDSEKNQHRGLKNLLLGINYSVRNVNAHELKIKWQINEDKAINMLSIISSLHKELDECHFILQS